MTLLQFHLLAQLRSGVGVGRGVGWEMSDQGKEGKKKKLKETSAHN